MPKRMTPQQWVDGINALAKPKKQETRGVRVRVLVRSVLAGPDHKAIGWVEPDEIVIVAGGRYARGLVEKGFVTLDTEVPVIPEPDEPEATAAARKLAGEFSIDLRQVTGTGRNERITKADVQAAVDNRFVVALQEIADEAAQEALEDTALASLDGKPDD